MGPTDIHCKAFEKVNITFKSLIFSTHTFHFGIYRFSCCLIYAYAIQMSSAEHLLNINFSSADKTVERKNITSKSEETKRELHTSVVDKMNHPYSYYSIQHKVVVNK